MRAAPHSHARPSLLSRIVPQSLRAHTTRGLGRTELPRSLTASDGNPPAGGPGQRGARRRDRESPRPTASRHEATPPRPDAPVTGTCDWGNCGIFAEARRFSDDHGWLPVCWLHSRDSAQDWPADPLRWPRLRWALACAADYGRRAWQLLRGLVADDEPCVCQLGDDGRPLAGSQAYCPVHRLGYDGGGAPPPGPLCRCPFDCPADCGCVCHRYPRGGGEPDRLDRLDRLAAEYDTEATLVFLPGQYLPVPVEAAVHGGWLPLTLEPLPPPPAESAGRACPDTPRARTWTPPPRQLDDTVTDPVARCWVDDLVDAVMRAEFLPAPAALSVIDADGILSGVAA